MESAMAPWPTGRGAEIQHFPQSSLPKLRSIPISMKKQQNFDCRAGFCLLVVSASLFRTHIRSQNANLVSGTPGTSED
jgi:hypothetical protein